MTKAVLKLRAVIFCARWVLSLRSTVSGMACGSNETSNGRESLATELSYQPQNQQLSWIAGTNGCQRSWSGSERKVLKRQNLLAVLRACFETYNRVPDEQEMKHLRTELARKFDLFFVFTIHMASTAFFKRPSATGETRLTSASTRRSAQCRKA